MWWRLKVARIAAGVFVALLSASSDVSAAEAAPRIAVNALAAGGLSRTDLGFGMLEARTLLSKNLLVGAGPAVVVLEGGEPEYQFRAQAALLLRTGPIQFDDRNLWVFSDAGTTRYRNRLRLTFPVSMGEQTLRFQLFDEAYYQQNGPGWFRNVIAGGVGIDVNRAFSADAYWMRYGNDNRPDYSMFLMLLTLRLR